MSKLNPIDKWRFRRVINNTNPDILFTHGISPFRFLSTTISFSPVVYLPGGGDITTAYGQPHTDKNWLIKKYYTTFYRKLLSEVFENVNELWMAKYFDELNELGLNEKNFRPLDYVAVDTNIFYPRETTLNYGGEDDLIVGVFRRMHTTSPLKPGFVKILNAISKAIKNKKNIHLLIGGFPAEDNSLSEFIKRKISDLSIGSEVTMVEKVKKEKLPLYLSRLDVYVNIPYTGIPGGKGLGTTAKEAMACGCALIHLSNESPVQGEIEEHIQFTDKTDVLLELLTSFIGSKKYVEKKKTSTEKIIKQTSSYEAVRENIYNASLNIIKNAG
jgi:glycosyltransferase involved in cell wall biosynthesis